MARGHTATKSVIVNNKAAVTVSKVLEQVVINGTLAFDHNDTNPGVNSRNA